MWAGASLLYVLSDDVLHSQLFVFCRNKRACSHSSHCSVCRPQTLTVSPLPPPGQQVIEEQRRRLAELKQRAAAEAQCQWEALHCSQPHLVTSSSPSPSYSPIMAYSPVLSHTSLGPPPLVHHSILHHQPPSAGEQPYDTLSLESSDSMDTSVSTGNNSACSPDNMSGYDAHTVDYGVLC